MLKQKQAKKKKLKKIKYYDNKNYNMTVKLIKEPNRKLI